jgi:MinD-like ATPase involved in chromosome partitioning or flagellar assembly
MRPDQQDYEGTGVTVEIARSLDVPRLMLIVNKTPPAFDTAEVRTRVEETYACKVAAVLPHSEEMMNLASSGIFALHYPDHPMTEQYRDIARQLTAQ